MGLVSANERHRWQLALLVLTTLSLLVLLHPYKGLIHDARLYTLQALNHLRPDLYANDIFLRLGSQDTYTVFSPLFAWAIAPLGVERAAATLSGVSMLLVLAAAWTVSSSMMSRMQSALALLLLALVPSSYGSANIFHYLEEFLTPRPLAESLALFGIAAALTQKPFLSYAAAGIAMLIHPIIGAAGLAFLAAHQWVVPHLQRRWMALAIIGLVFAASIGSVLLPLEKFQLDPSWHRIVVQREYLSLVNWSADDWGRVATVFVSLAFAAIILENTQRRVALSAGVAAGTLLILAWWGGDGLRLVIVVQAQTWRVLWLATMLSIILLPPLYARGWHRDASSRCSLVLLASCWLSTQGVLTLVLAPASLLLLFVRPHALPARPVLWLKWGCWTGLAFTTVFGFATLLLAWNEGLATYQTLSPVLRRAALAGENGVLAAVIVALGILSWRVRTRAALLGLAALPVTAIALATPATVAAWSYREYDEPLHAAYQNWRDRIPPGSEVLWLGAGLENEAVYTWLLLERPAFITKTQMPNALFSRAAAMEMDNRAKQLSWLVPYAGPYGDSTKSKATPIALNDLCDNLSLRFVVTPWPVIGGSPLRPPAVAPFPLNQNMLYICP